MARVTTDDVAENPFQGGDFDAILDRSAEEIHEPSRAPTGPWIVRCVGYFIRKTPKEDLAEDPSKPLGSVIFYHTPDTPLDGVDPEAVEAGEWRGRRIQTKRNIKEIGDDAKIKALVEMHGVSPEGRTLREMLDQCKGRTIRASVSMYDYTRRDTGETVIMDQLSNFAPVGE